MSSFPRSSGLLLEPPNMCCGAFALANYIYLLATTRANKYLVTYYSGTKRNGVLAVGSGLIFTLVNYCACWRYVNNIYVLIVLIVLWRWCDCGINVAGSRV
jgi:hypothetical protein